MSKRGSVCLDGGRTVLALAIFALLWVPAVSWGAALTCLSGTDPSDAGDLGQIATVRSAIDSTCICANFDGSSGKTHSKYVSCAKGVIAAQVSAGNLRKQCKSTVTAYYSNSTCGFPASQNKEPCLKKSAAGKVSCAIKPAAKCTATACQHATLCVDAADSNHDGLIGAGDTGSCGAVCGNGFVETGEQCDPPDSACSDTEICTGVCTCVTPSYACCSHGGACLYQTLTNCGFAFGTATGSFHAAEHCSCDASDGICGGSCEPGLPPAPPNGCVNPANEGQPCDDGDPLTYVDQCTGGTCAGTRCPCEGDIFPGPTGDPTWGPSFATEQCSIPFNVGLTSTLQTCFGHPDGHYWGQLYAGFEILTPAGGQSPYCWALTQHKQDGGFDCSYASPKKHITAVEEQACGLSLRAIAAQDGVACH